MFSRVIKSALPVSLTAIALLAGAAASAQSVQAIQTLDRVDVYNKSKVLEMEFDDPGRTFDFTALDITPTTATGFVACQVTASQALYCIDGKDVRYWAKPSQVAAPNTAGSLLFSCTDTALGLDGTSAKPCTALTVDISSAIWVAGKKVNGTYSLYKLVAKVGTCPASPWFALQGAAYCVKEYASGRRLLPDITPIDGEVAAEFTGPGGVMGSGVLALEESPFDPTLPADELFVTTALFVPDPATAPPVVIARGGLDWGLTAGEFLQSVTLQQLPIAGFTRNFVLAATSKNRILAVDARGGSPAFPVFNIVAERIPVPPAVTAPQCNFDSQRYGLRASTKSGRVYLTDRNFCQAVALEFVADASNPFRLANVQEAGSDLTFSTTAAYPPDANTIAPGIVVDLSTCGSTCVLLSDKDGAPAAGLSNVKLVGPKSGMTLFQVKEIPDCRWAPDLCAGKTNVVVDANGNSVPLPAVVSGSVNGPLSNANALFLNVTPLLPVEITALFDGSGKPPKGLPKLLISPQYRAQDEQGFLFEALFGITDDGVVFQGTFDLLFDVGKLAGNKLGCGYDYSEAMKPNRDWDVTTTVSERVVTAGGPASVADPNNGNRYVDTLVNTGCVNPTKGSGERWSMYAYNLEIAPSKDDVFAQLLLTLFNDLDETRAELACKQVDTTGAAPLASKVCTSLRTAWSDAKNSLDRCYSASVQPKSSASKERCNTFLVKLRAYETILKGAVTSGPDPANRLGELKARVNVLFHVYNDRFLPSIPANGFKLL